MIIRGYDAIDAAKELKLPLGKYSERSHRGFRLDLSLEEAGRLVTEDENLIFLELDIHKLTIEQLMGLSAALGGEPGRPFTELRERYSMAGDDDRAEIFEAMALRWSELKARSH